MDFRKKSSIFALIMSQETFVGPIATLRGKDKTKSNRSHRTRNGKTFTYTWNPENKQIISPAKTLQQYAMSLANLRAKDILSDPEQRAAYESDFRSDDKYSELRPYVVARCFQSIKSAALSGDTEILNRMLALIRKHPDRTTREAKLSALNTYFHSPES